MTCSSSHTFSPSLEPLPLPPPSVPPCFGIPEPFQLGSCLFSSPYSPSSTASSSTSSDLDPCSLLSEPGDLPCLVKSVPPEALQMPFLQEMPDWGPCEFVGPPGVSRKRFTISDLEELMEIEEADGYLWMEAESSGRSKRLRGANGWVSAEKGRTAVVRPGDFGSWPLEGETELDASQTEGRLLQMVAKAQEQKTARVACEASESCLEDANTFRCGDLDDILDVLLQKSEPVALEPPPTVLSAASLGSPRMSSNVTETSQESPLVHVNVEPISNHVQLPDNRDLSFASTMASLLKRDTLIEQEQTEAIGERVPRRRSWDWQVPTSEPPATAPVQTYPVSRPLSRGSGSNHSIIQEREKERFLKPSTTDLLQQSQLKPSGCKGERVHVWAGPTLLEIESALAHKDSSSLMFSMKTKRGSSPLLSFSECMNDEAARSNGSSSVREDGACRGEVPSNEESRFNSWRMLLRKGAGEPKYTLRLRCEEECVSDGYRWRKYGQKTIKGSPHPRSYYRCTSTNCSSKKQVERSCEDPRLLLVTYEGIHLHPQPNPLANCISSHLVEEDGNLHHGTMSSISPSSSSTCTLSSSDSKSKSDFGALVGQCTSPCLSCIP